MMMMVQVSKQHKVTTKYKKRISPLFVSWEKTLSHINAGRVGFAAGQVDFQVTLPAGQVAVGTIFEA